MVPLLLYSDDTSGNRSKRWNKHESWLFSLAGLPFQEAQRSYHIHFIGTSNVASGMEIVKTIVDQLNEDNGLLDGMSGYDAAAKEEVLIIGGVLCVLADNPMHSEIISHVGLQGRWFCRICKSSYGKSAAGLRNYLQVGFVFMCSCIRPRSFSKTSPLQIGAIRNWDESEATAKEHANLCCARDFGKISQSVTETGIKDRIVGRMSDAIKNLATTCTPQDLGLQIHLKFGDPERWINPFFHLGGFDGHLDTPIEILHTILLGVIKYLSKETIGELNVQQKAILSARISATSYTLFDRPINANQIIRYVGSCVGKDFKAFVQVAPFVLHGLVSEELMDSWISVATMACLAFTRTINDAEEYLPKLGRTIQDMFCKVSFSLLPLERLR
jgi:hypothetical protein